MFVSERVVDEDNSLANVLADANKAKPGAAEKWQEQQQVAIKEACSGNTPMYCQQAVAGTVMSGGVLPEAMVISEVISSGVVTAIDYGITGSVEPNNGFVE
ncbi:hypothetical protein [Pluralibacter sp.]|uniref:hypothetical protein n=1 Tax=Pluralibacter sp. TaxID=1920032 RepID=UPI0025DD843F|nr:hypothetical protein [Pluralibacter sp.]MBV8042005.1 hypothetical protein [Pluralibacter sp.]